MIEKKTQRKLNLAVAITEALDDPFYRMAQDYSILLSEMVQRLQIDCINKEVNVSIEFVQERSLALLITTLMHEARHWSLNHHERWQSLKQMIYESNIPREFYVDGAGPKQTLLFMFWNIAADCEIYPLLSHMPIVREEAAIRAGKYPCSTVKAGTAEQMMHQLMHKEEARKEALEFISK